MQPQARRRLEDQAAWLESTPGLVIDADVHATDIVRCPRRPVDHYYHGRPISAEDIITEMDMAGVDVANIWQNPASTPYPGGEDENAASLLESNRYIRDAADRYARRFIPSGWTDPKACGVRNACSIATTCVKEFGFFIVKMNPAQNRYPIDSPEVTAVVDHIVELGAVPAFHYGADTQFTPASGLERIARRHPDHPVIGVHMGGGGAGYLEAEGLYHDSRELGLRCPNIRFIFSAKRDTHIEEALITYQLAGEPFSRNLFCASDAPYGRMSWNYGGFRAMFASLQSGAVHTDPRVRANPRLFTTKAIDGYLGENFAQFAAASSRRLIAKYS